TNHPRPVAHVPQASGPGPTIGVRARISASTDTAFDHVVDVATNVRHMAKTNGRLLGADSNRRPGSRCLRYMRYGSRMVGDEHYDDGVSVHA
ncbi:MAG: hypothetical protein P8N50_04460, partial [Actinomycetota bacterium]|nr:hypothetical protein [Actinomycetota bacterium]